MTEWTFPLRETEISNTMVSKIKFLFLIFIFWLIFAENLYASITIAYFGYLLKTTVIVYNLFIYYKDDI